MALSDFLKQSPVDKSASVLAKAESDHAAAVAKVAEHTHAFGLASLDGGDVKKAADDLAAAQRVESGARAALALAQSRHRQALVEAKKNEVSAAWSKAEKAMADREAALATLNGSMEAFAKAYHRVIEANGDLYAAIPTVRDTAALALDRPSLEGRIRKNLVRLGLPWAIGWPWPPSEIPPFLSEFAGGPDVLASWRRDHMAKFVPSEASNG